MSQTTSPEEKPAEPTRTLRTKALRLGLLSVIALSTAGGAYGGYELIGEGSVSSDRGKHIDQAHRDARCAKAVQMLSRSKSVAPIVHISALTKQEQADCGVDWVISQITKPEFTGSNTLPGHIVSTKVKLHSLTKLEVNEHQQYAAAAAIEDPGAKVAGTMLGTGFGAIGSALVLGCILVGAKRRRDQGTPPPATVQATSS